VIQFYSKFFGHDSFAHVSRRLVVELHRKRLDGGCFQLGFPAPWPDLPWPPQVLRFAPIGIYCGYPPGCEKFLEGHALRILVTVCETSPIPADWVEICNAVHLVVVPSRFCAETFAQCGVKTDIMVVPHGIEPELLDHPALEPDDRLLHVTAALSFPRRKGTPALILAAQSMPHVGFEIKIPDYPGAHQLAKVVPPNVRIDMTPYGPEQWLQRLANALAVLQPSAGEGFGLCPLEAKALGVPSIASGWSGHADHLDPEIDVIIGHPHIEEPLETQANPIGRAGRVHHSMVRWGIEQFLPTAADRRAAARRWRKTQGREWLWERVTDKFTTWVANQLHTVRQVVPLKYGEESGAR
jgi:glycosyltransferase involved in cell wall biosynthesis